MIILRSRSLIIPNDEYNLGNNYDTNTATRVFQLDRVMEGIDLANLAFKLDLTYADGTNDTLALDSEVTDDKINLTWTVTKNQLHVPGTVVVQIRALNVDGNMKWSSYIGAFFVEASMFGSADYSGKLSEIEQFEAIIADEKKRVINEKARQDAEAERVQAEAGRKTAEEERKTAESERKSAETARSNAESERDSAETARASAESKRETAEEGRKSAETARVTAETARADAEAERAQAESGRKSAEEERETAEESRKAAETARAKAETARQGAETARATAEEGRKTAEDARKSAETARVTAETAREEWYNSAKANFDAAVASGNKAEQIANSLESSVDASAKAAAASATAAASSAETASEAAENATASKTAAAASAKAAADSASEVKGDLTAINEKVAQNTKDIATANSSHVPYSGATKDLDMGEHVIKAVSVVPTLSGESIKNSVTKSSIGFGAMDPYPDSANQDIYFVKEDTNADGATERSLTGIHAADPTENTHAATKKYVDTADKALDAKVAANAAAIAETNNNLAGYTLKTLAVSNRSLLTSGSLSKTKLSIDTGLSVNKDKIVPLRFECTNRDGWMPIIWFYLQDNANYLVNFGSDANGQYGGILVYLEKS